MKKKINSIFHIVLLIFFCVIVLTAVGYCFYYFQLGSEYFDNKAKDVAQVYSQQTKQEAEESIEKIFSNVRGLAGDLSSVIDAEELNEFGKSKISQLDLVCLQMLKDGVTEYEYGQVIGYSGAKRLRDVIASGKFGSSEIYRDDVTGLQCVAVYCPVYGNDETDGVIAYYSLETIFGDKQMLHDKASYQCLAMADGSISEQRIPENEEPVKTSNVFTYIYDLTESKTEEDAVKRMVAGKTHGFTVLHTSGKNYVAASFPVESLGEDYFILQLFEEENLLQNERVLSTGIFAVSVFIIVMSIVALIACAMIIHMNKKKLLDEAECDPILGCNTYNKFAYEARSLLDENKFSRYAVVNFDIYKFEYLNEHLSPDDIEEVLKYISKVCQQMTDANETVGHVIDDSFVILMHYMEMTDLSERVKLLGALVSNYSVTQKIGMDIRLSVGIYLVQGDSGKDIQKMFDCAKIALKTNKMRIDAPYTVYDSSVASAYLQEAEIEFKMHQALKNKDFKLFFQPKYSIANDSIESAEVLVRWYNPETQTYIAPDSFIRVFEANGFVSELDHYVFEETCRFLNDLTEHGEKIVPLSVNVSRATAIKPGFLNFYVSKKKEYGVEDGFITLEFTETFAAESCEILEHLLTVLKNNGFKCAIDDFGMGNSSVIAVKELPVDELKFDRALIKRSNDTEKDDLILRMLIDVSKELGMQVTQEGVETREDMDRMRVLGCDVVQGYYYSKPMQTVDFIDFLKDDTSLAGVKRFDKTAK